MAVLSQASVDVIINRLKGVLGTATNVVAETIKYAVEAATGAPEAHAASHQNGGTDEPSVAGLSGELADNQPPKDHASGHTDGTDDVADVVGDSGSGGAKGLVPAPGTGDAAAGKFLKADGAWTAPAGGGDVTGPGSSTDEAIARFNGAGGKTIQDYTSGAPTINDTGSTTFVKEITVTLPADEQILVDGRTNNRISSLGVVRINLTPASGDIGEDCIHLDVDANSVNDIMAIIVNYLATGLAAGNENMALELNVQTADATGGVVAGVEVTKSGIGTLEVQGVHCNADVIPIHQESGAFGNVEQAWEFEAGPTWTDVTAAFNSAVTDVEIFSAENDIIYIGDAATFEEINVTLATVASGAGIKPKFEFSVGSGSWTEFTPNDTTRGFRNTGLVAWEIGDVPSWATDTVNGTTNKYWIRITRTAVSLTTPPIEDRVQVASTIEYDWDENGNITANSIAVPTIQLGSALADGKYSGIVEAGVAGATLAFGDVIYQAVGDTRWELAKADAESTCVGKIGICVLAAANDGSATTILLYGKVRADAVFPTFTAFAPVYIDEATAGDLKSAAPSTSTNIVRPVGYANSGDELFFCPGQVYVKVA